MLTNLYITCYTFLFSKTHCYYLSLYLTETNASFKYHWLQNCIQITPYRKYFLNKKIVFCSLVCLFVCLFVWNLWHINLCRLFNIKYIFVKTNSSISNNSFQHKYSVQLSKTFLFQGIQLIQTVLIQRNQLSIRKEFYLKKSVQHNYVVKMSKQFYFKQFSLA